MKIPESIILIFLLAPLCSQAQNQHDSAKVHFSLHGYVKDMPSLSFKNFFDSVNTLNIFHNRMRAAVEFPKNFSVHAELRNRFFSGSQLKNTPGFADGLEKDDGLVDMSFVPVSGDSYAWHLNIDRLYANWNNEHWDITAGRQRINWGVHTVWNPNDIFNAYNYLDFDYEERPGSDALRIQYTTTGMHTMEAAWRFGKNKYDQTAALMYKFNMHEYDVQLLGGIMKNDVVLGTGLAGNAGNAGLKGEITWFHPRTNEFDSTDAVSMTIGIDYTNRKNWYFNGSYLLLTGGSNNADVKALELLGTASAKNLVPFRHTFFMMANRTVNPLLTAGLSYMYAPGGKNYLIFFPTLSYSIGANTDLSFYAQSFWGKSDQSYKAMGTALYTRIKWSF